LISIRSIIERKYKRYSTCRGIVGDSVESGILDDSSEVVGPCEVVDTILLILEGSGGDFGVKMFADLICKTL
jgi:hypothetical protein